MSNASGLTNELSIVERLRTEADLCRNETADYVATLLDEAAAEIERLRAALTTIAAYCGRIDVAHQLAGIAEAALSPDLSPID